MTSTMTRTLPPYHPSPPLNLLPTPNPTTTPTTLTLTQHASTLSSDTYTLALPSGEALYTTTSSPANKKWTSRRTFLDAGGQPVFDLRCANGKPLRWSVGLPGREDCDDDEALATLQWSQVMGQERVEVLFGEGQARKLVGRKEKGLGGEAAEGRRASSKDVVVFDGEEAVVRTRIVGNGLKARVPFRDNEWEVGVGEGVDVALAAAISVFLAITLCEKPAISKSQMLVGMLLPTGGGFAMGAGAGGFGVSAVGGGGGGGDGGGGGGGGGC